MDEKPMINDLHRGMNGYDSDVDRQGMVEETIRRVKEQSDRLQAAAMPYANRLRSFAEEKPVLFTYLAVFAITSCIPIACFIGFMISATLFIVGVAAVGICVSILGTILFASSILLPVLFFTSLLSLSILSFLLSLFLAQRLYVHLTTSSSNSPTGKADLRALSVGMRGWAEETASRAGVDYGKFDMPTVLGKWGGVNGYGSGEGKIVGIKKEGTKLELEVPAGVTVRAVGNDSGSEVMY